MEKIVITPLEAVSHPEAGSIEEEMSGLMEDLYPLCRSITGRGTVETLLYLQQLIPLAIKRIPTGTQVFDWQIPKEWNIRDAWLKNARGEKVIDFKNSNLHVVSYSVPVKTTLPLAELKTHLHTLPEHPDWIPYRTTYYNEDWGFCISYNQLKTLTEGNYEVFIDSTLEPGHLAYGELVLEGQSAEEVLVSTHICHPSLCNDNLSGIAVTTFLAREMMKRKRRYTYRFLFTPATIGIIAWLAINEPGVHRIRHGLVAALLGDPGPFTYKRSRKGNTEIDHAVEYVLTHNNQRNKIRNFEPYGYSERQFCSPGFNLPVGCLTRTSYAEYPEYHTSADNLDFIKAAALKESLDIYLEVIRILEQNRSYLNLKPKCEPQLGKYDLYNKVGGENNGKDFQMALLWALNFSDGHHTLLDIARSSPIKFEMIADAAARLKKAGLLEEVSAITHPVERI